MNRKEEIIEQTLMLNAAGFRTTYAISQVLKRAKWLHGINERQCNGYPEYGDGKDMTEDAQLKDEAREERIKAQILDLFTKNASKPVYLNDEADNITDGIVIEFQGDPRGAPLIIYKDGQVLGRVWG